jgi:uncharacterized FAD-dependent dehydrogenase
MYFDGDRTKKIKTHCFCRNGQILLLHYFGLPLAGGHSRYIEIDNQFDEARFPNANFAILYKDANNPYLWDEAIAYMKRINGITEGSLLVQRLGDLKASVPTRREQLKRNKVQPSNMNITVGDIDPIMPLGFRERFFTFLDRLNKVVPGILDDDTLIYAPAIEWWMDRINVNENMEILNVPNVYAIGDGAGLTQGIVQSAASGILAARAVSKKLSTTSPESEEFKCAC